MWLWYQRKLKNRMILRQILKGNLKYYLFLFFLVIFMDFFSPLREEVSAQQHMNAKTNCPFFWCSFFIFLTGLF